MSDDLAALLPQAKPWDQRANGVLPLAGGYTRYFDTLAWILQQCRDDHLDQGELQQRYMAAYSLDPYVALVQIQGLQKYGLLAKESNHLAATVPSVRWMETQGAGLVIGTMHANLKLVGELLHEIRQPRTRRSLLEAANSGYGFGWQKDSQIAYRLGWLRSAGFAQQRAGNTYEATRAGLDFLECIEVHQPEVVPAPASPPPAASTAPRAESLTHPQVHTGAAEIAERLRTLACDGARHKDFEAAVRDAFEFLGFAAELRSGSGQTDVLISGLRKINASGRTHMAPSRYTAVVEVKAVGNGRLTSNQVNLSTIKKHRDDHGADYALVVGPAPAGQLIGYARDEGIGVLASEQLEEIVLAQAEVPLPAREYQSLFSDAQGQPQGGTVDRQQLEEVREGHKSLRDLLLGVFRAVSEIDASSAGTTIAPVVQFALNRDGISAPLEEVEGALNVLAMPWLDGLKLVEDGSHRHFVTATTPRLLAQRLRWLADAFDEAADQEGGTPESG